MLMALQPGSQIQGERKRKATGTAEITVGLGKRAGQCPWLGLGESQLAAVGIEGLKDQRRQWFPNLRGC